MSVSCPRVCDWGVAVGTATPPLLMESPPLVDDATRVPRSSTAAVGSLEGAVLNSLWRVEITVGRQGHILNTLLRQEGATLGGVRGFREEGRP